jgi:hypothetical protein
LYVTITNQDDEIVGRGTLHIQPKDFYQELLTFGATGLSPWSRLTTVATFLGYFMKQLSVPFFSTLGSLQWPNAGIDTALMATSPSQVVPLVASDGVKTTLMMWNPIQDGKEVLGDAPIILFVAGAATDHTMFALPTIEINAVDYFRSAGYRSYCLTHRVGRTPVAQKGHTPYDARRDIHAALAYIRKISSTGGDKKIPKIYVVAHCAGSSALACGLLDGTIPVNWLQGVTASMVFMNPKFGKINHLISGFPVNAYSKFVSSYWDCRSSRHDTLIQRALNQVLRLYPAGDARETCKSVVCHRSELVFGR